MLEELLPVGEGDCVVQPGDSIASIAARSGHLADTIWNDPANAALKEARQDPELLLPGDRLTVIPLRSKSVACATGGLHVFRRVTAQSSVTIVLEDEAGQPFAGKRYEVDVDNDVRSGTTDDAGRIVFAVSRAMTTATLKVWLEEPGYDDPLERDVALSHLYPLRHPLGVQQRLANLGFYEGALDGATGPELLEAALAFAAAAGLQGTTDIDDTLLAKLAEISRT
ncbi:MAG: LysM peptidoglycan-binding domain-containing protein [Thermoanaerobaculia bacterium]